MHFLFVSALKPLGEFTYIRCFMPFFWRIKYEIEFWLRILWSNVYYVWLCYGLHCVGLKSLQSVYNDSIWNGIISHLCQRNMWNEHRLCLRWYQTCWCVREFSLWLQNLRLWVIRFTLFASCCCCCCVFYCFKLNYMYTKYIFYFTLMDRHE